MGKIQLDPRGLGSDSTLMMTMTLHCPYDNNVRRKVGSEHTMITAAVQTTLNQGRRRDRSIHWSTSRRLQLWHYNDFDDRGKERMTPNTSCIAPNNIDLWYSNLATVILPLHVFQGKDVLIFKDGFRSGVSLTVLSCGWLSMDRRLDDTR